MTVRQDAWSDEEDRVLAETVLQYIEEGSTQLKAFEEVGNKLYRTAAACGFRWNSTIRKQYQDQIVKSKRSRKQRTSLKPSIPRKELPASATNEVIGALEQIKKAWLYQHDKQGDLQSINDKLSSERDRLASEVVILEKKLSQTSADYTSLLHVIDRARQWSSEKE
ncbi:RsfA family transcriptional regulator [Aureibacillus halotolerans]|uniref:RsfA family transcription factor n=1 Tax=Aureibacillus halotolerans TaxID=1508390 RepID=A0A4R6UB82_9BACI|nr:RsfA family transcriptional regulator [Aureibacillus halotolerans]TDQ42313.1 RsfA family transcription factor [Aureibacillus halotolerans]